MKFYTALLASMPVLIAVLVFSLIPILVSSMIALRSARSLAHAFNRIRGGDKHSIFREKGTERDFLSELAVQEQVYRQWSLRMSRRERHVVAEWMRVAAVDWSLVSGAWGRTTWRNNSLYPRSTNTDRKMRRALHAGSLLAMVYGIYILGVMIFSRDYLGWFNYPIFLPMILFGVAAVEARCARPFSKAIELSSLLSDAGIAADVPLTSNEPKVESSSSEAEKSSALSSQNVKSTRRRRSRENRSEIIPLPPH